MYKLSQQVAARKITPKEAEQFLALNNFPGQRALQEAKAKRYGELLTAGRLRPVEIAFATCPDGNRYLMNGQHVCQGCVWSGREMHAKLEYYKCETWTDAWQLFATFDVHASRTQNQIFNAARGLFGNEELRSVPIRVLSACGAALVSLNNGKVDFRRIHKTADKTSKPQLVEEHAKDVLWIQTFADAPFMMRVGCVTAMIATHRKNAEKAEIFWRKVQSGLGFKSKTEPEKRIRDFLQSPTVGQMNSRSHHEAVYATCICWWNSFVTGESRHSVKIAAMSEMPAVKS